MDIDRRLAEEWCLGQIEVGTGLTGHEWIYHCIYLIQHRPSAGAEYEPNRCSRNSAAGARQTDASLPGQWQLQRPSDSAAWTVTATKGLEVRVRGEH